jgi:hypothetical protein
MQNFMGKLTIVASEGTQISWENSNQQLTLSSKEATQPLILNIKYSSTDNSSALSANTLTLSWDAAGGSAPLKATVGYESSYNPGSWVTIAENILGEGSYTWTLPETENSGIEMQIKVSDSSPQAQTASAITNIQISRTPKTSIASFSIPIYPSYIQTFELFAALIAAVLYVRKMKAKRLSMLTLNSKASVDLKK